jgi:hypothetical protein
MPLRKAKKDFLLVPYKAGGSRKKVYKVAQSRLVSDVDPRLKISSYEPHTQPQQSNSDRRTASIHPRPDISYRYDKVTL